MFSSGQLSWLNQYGEAWGFMPSDKAIVFVDNHDNQRGSGGGGQVLTYKDGRLYELATAYELAWPYGYPQLMSSFAFTDPSQGPPSDGARHTDRIWDGGDGCFGAWVCEHRRRPMANMVAFRNATAGAFFTANWWTNGNNQIAFSRGDRGFFALDRESNSLQRTFQTGLAPGVYCDVMNGDFDRGTCSGRTVTVASDGTASINVDAMSAVALHVGARLP